MRARLGAEEGYEIRKSLQEGRGQGEFDLVIVDESKERASKVVIE